MYTLVHTDSGQVRPFGESTHRIKISVFDYVSWTVWKQFMDCVYRSLFHAEMQVSALADHQLCWESQRACDEKEWILYLYSCDIIGQMLLVMLYKIHFLFSLYSFGFCNSDIAVISAYVKLIPSQNVTFQKPVHKMSKKLIIVSHFLKIS